MGSVEPDGILLNPISFIRVSENPVNLWICLSGSESEGGIYYVLTMFYYNLLCFLRTQDVRSLAAPGARVQLGFIPGT